ncbi:13886_t:CDS:2 [Entrophospora sp. SA101]|nr:6610_t:CDS:2 [Entrophospora sp. SA101]CAJ0907032.1 13886_t:CDS:2 [Entrophospora sp. SA101]
MKFFKGHGFKAIPLTRLQSCKSPKTATEVLGAGDLEVQAPQL